MNSLKLIALILPSCMTDTEKLITSARRYCQDNHAFWTTKYAQERTGSDFPYTYSDNDYDLFPRYNVLFAILDRVEFLVEQPYPDFQACKNELKDIGHTANTVFTTGEQNNIASRAMLEERFKFVRFVESTSIDSLKLIVRLPYRRRLKEEESNNVRKNLLDKWGYDGELWEPLQNKSPEQTLFIMKGNLTDSDCERISHTIKEKASSRLFEITEDNKDAVIDISEFDLDCYETIYCDNSFQWVVYGSHESTVAFGGAWMLDFIEQLYSDRKELLNKYDENL